MPLTTIDGSKSTTVTYQPLLLAVFTFASGSVLRASTHPLKVGDGGVQYGGNDYLGRISEQDIAQVQALSEQGIDVTPSVTIHFADADKVIWLNFEQVHGFKGAILELTFVFYDIDAGTFSSDSLKKFKGICDTPSADDRSLTVTANSLINVQRRQFPIMPIQRRCPLVNPVTLAQRAEANDEDSIYFECGETRDLTTAPPCKYTVETCTQLLHRANITFEPAEGGRSREYTSGQWIDLKNNPNEAKYGDYFPMIYGTAWVEPPIMNVIGDGNSTRGEVVVCNGEVEDILKVIVNDVEVPAATSMTGSAYLVQDPLFRWNLINRGDRDGSPNTDTPYNGDGDPYGNLCALMFVVPRKVADAASTPRVRVLVRGPKIRVYTDATTYTHAYTENPVWILLDLLIWTNFTYADIDMDTFVAAAAVCDEAIDYEDQNGNTSSHARFACSLAIRQRRPAAEIIRGVRQSCNAILVPNSSTGNLQIFIRQTLAAQQPAAQEGANDNTAIPSVQLDGTVANGYAAWHFSDGTILRDEQGRSSLRLFQQPISSSPNRVSFQFSDDALMRAASSLSLVDSEDVSRAAQEVTGSLQIDGVPNYDQAVRVARSYLAEVHRGNEEGDTRGTRWFECEESFAVIRLRVGQIGRLSSPANNIANQLVRITKIQPTRNFETARVTGHFHDDLWYTDAYGQEPEPRYSRHRRDRLARPSFPWAPYEVQPDASDALHEQTRWTFKLQPQYEVLADGTVLTRLEITGRIPVNDFSYLLAPLVQVQGTTASTGGTLAGGGWLYWIVVCATDVDGKLTGPSALCRVAVTGGGSAHTITVPVVSWDSGTMGWVAFAGKSPNTLTYQDEGSGTPDTITLTDFNEAAWGVPDGEFDRLLVKVKRIAHSGVWGAAVTVVGTGTVTIGGAAWTANEWTGYAVSLLSKADGSAVPVWNQAVISNTADVLTVADSTSVAVGDVVVMRSKPTLSNGNRTLTDAKWANGLSGNGSGMTAADELGRLVRIIAGAGRGQVRRIESATSTSVTVDSDWDGPLDASTRYIIEEPNWLPESAGYGSGNNAAPDGTAALTVSVDNYRGQVVLVQVFTLDGGNHESVDSGSPFREIYIPGTPLGLKTITGNYTITREDRTILVDTTAAEVTVTLLPGAEMEGLSVLIKLITNGSGDTVPGNDAIVEAAAGEDIEGAASMTLTEKGQFFEVVGVQ
jgi:hypothetical protein